MIASSFRSFLLLPLIILSCLVAADEASADYELTLNKGLAAYLRRDYQTTAELMRVVLEQSPESPLAHHLLGLSLYRLARYVEALPYLEKALALDPGMEGIEMDLGNLYLRMGEWRKALAQFEKAASREPASGLAFYTLGYTQLLLEQYDSAALSMDTASGLDPELALYSSFYAGVCRYKLRNYFAAEQSFLRAHALGEGTRLGTTAQKYLDYISWLTKRYYGVLSTGFQYDTNVTLQPDEVTISGKDDVRAIFYLDLGYKPYLSDEGEVVVSWQAYFSFHKDIDELNVQTHELRLRGTRRTELGGVPVDISLQYSYDLVLVERAPAHELFSQSHSVAADTLVRWSALAETESELELRLDNFKDFAERDALNVNWTLGQRFNLYQGRLRLTPGIGVELNFSDSIPGTRDYDEFTPKVFMEALAILPHGFSIFTEGIFFVEDHYNDEFARVDYQFGFRAVVSKILYKTISLDLGYQHISNLSRSDFPGSEPFQYFRNILSATFSARF